MTKKNYDVIISRNDAINYILPRESNLINDITMWGKFTYVLNCMSVGEDKIITISYRYSRQGVFCKKGVLRNFTNFTEKHLCQSLFFNKVAGLRSATLLKKRLWHRCFPANFAKFLRTPFLTEQLRQLLLFIRTWTKKMNFLRVRANFYLRASTKYEH